MWPIILRKKTFYLAVVGVLLGIILVYQSGKKPPEPKPLVKPNQTSYARSVAASGIIEAVDENIRLAPATSGLVQELHVKTGQTVKRGDLLVQLDDRELQGQWLVQKANFEKLNTRYGKVQSLSMPEALSREERDNLRYDWNIAKAELKRLELLLDQLKIKAPVDGVALQVNTRVGEFLSTPMNTDDSYVAPVVLGKSGGLQVRADVDEVNAGLVKMGAKAQAFVKGSQNQKPIALSFVRIDPYVIPKRSLTGDNRERVDTRVLQVIFHISDSRDLYVGQQLDVYLEY